MRQQQLKNRQFTEPAVFHQATPSGEGKAQPKSLGPSVQGGSRKRWEIGLVVFSSRKGAEVGSAAKSGEGGMRSFTRWGVRDELERGSIGREGAAAGEWHALAEVLRVSGSGDAEVAKHRV